MKLLIIFLIAILPFTMAVDGTCASHPKVNDIQALIDSLEDEIDSSDFAEISSAFTAYRESNGDSAWTWAVSGETNQCTGFGDGSNSCCNDDLAKHFKTIFGGNVKKQRKMGKPSQKAFVEQFMKQAGKCGGPTAAQDIIDLNGVSTFLSELKTCRQQQQETQVNFIRRNLCTLCFSGADMSTNFDDNGKLKIDQTSIDNYDTDVIADFTCFENLSSNLFDTLKSYFDNYSFSDGQTKACNRFQEWGNNLFYSDDGVEILKPSKPTAGDCKGKAKMFGKGCEEELNKDEFAPGGAKGPKSSDGSGGLPGDGTKPPQEEDETPLEGKGGSGGGDDTPLEGKRRILNDDTDFVVSSGGYEVYRDENASLDGDLVTSAFTQDEQIDVDPSSISIEADPEDDATTDNSSRLSIMVTLFIIILGAIF